MKKLFFLIIVITLFSFNMCYARNLETDELTRGGLPLGSTQEFVRSVYGNPISEQPIHDAYTGTCVVWKYSDTLHIIFRDGYLDGVITTADNGFRTPAGAFVGMPVYKLKAMYGDPLNYYRDKKVAGKGMLYYRTTLNRNIGMRFDFEGGKITKIMTGLLDG